MRIVHRRVSTFQADIGSARILYVPQPIPELQPISEDEFVERYIRPAAEFIRDNPELAMKWLSDARAHR
jgi:hypothetical protein